MNRLLQFYIIACIIMLASCATGRHVAPHHAMAGKGSNEPKFIDSVHIKGHNTQHMMAAGGQKTKSRINKVSPAGHQSLDVKQAEQEDPKFITYNNTDVPADVPLPKPATRTRHHRRHAREQQEDKAQTAQVKAAPAAVMPGIETDSILLKYARIIEQNPADMNNPMLYHFVDDWYGTVYRWGGSDMDGVDCSGFSQQLYEHIYNVDLLRTVKEQRHSCDKVKHIGEAEQGDLVFFKIRRFRVSHVGVYLANGYFVHASSSRGVTISNINEHYWHKRFAGCGRVEKGNGMTESEYTP